MHATALYDCLSALTRTGLAGLLGLLCAAPAVATTWTVDSTSADPALNACSAAAGDCSFPGAVSRLAFVGDSIVFSVASSLATEVAIARDVTIDAAGASLPKLRISTSVGWATVTVRNARWQNLNATVFSGGALSIAQRQIVTIEDSEFLYNRSVDKGGAIYNEGTLVVTRSRFEGNYSNNGAGGIHSTNFGSLTVLDSTFRGNGVLNPAGPGRQLGQFGAVSAENTLDIRGCVFVDNESSYASAVRGGGLLTRIYNSTFSGNKTFQATESGALLLGGPTRIANSTIVGNSGVTSGGLFVYTASDTQVINTLIANNTGASPEISGRIYSHGHNLIRDRTGAQVEGNIAGTDIYSTDPRLAPLANYGGLTSTLALQPESPALNAGSNCVQSVGGCGDFPHVALSNDQRGAGFPRLRAGTVDIGAFELGSLVVSNNQDSGAGSLRQAISDALPGDVISFSPSYFNQARNIALASTLVVNKSMSIVGPGASLLTLDANNLRRHLNVDAPATLNLRGMRFTRGNPGAGVSGGAILVNLGTLSASEISIDSSSGNVGGCIYNNGTLNLALARLSGCQANVAAGLFNEVGKTATISDTRIENNVATGPGGGIGNPGTLVLARVSLSGNQATIGGGLNSYGTATLTNTTFSGNSADNGGGMYLGGTGTTTLTHATVTANSAQYNGGVGAEFDAVVNLKGALIAGNTRSIDQAPDAGGNFTSFGYNLIGSTIGTTFRPSSPSLVGNITGAPARLASLADNGGYSLTHAPLYNSQAIDAGGPGLTVDGRGLARPIDFSNLTNASGGNGSDIGAYELQVSTPVDVVAAPATGGLAVSFSGGANGGPAISSYRVTCGSQTANGASSPITVSGLAAGAAVTCTVTASSGALTGIPSAPSNSAAPATVPGAPGIGTATAGNGEASVSFTAPPSNGGSAITGYTATCGAQSQSGSASPITVTGLANGTAMTCTVIATNAIGNSAPSAPSNSVTPASVPDAPTITGISAGDGSATVSFSPPTNDGGAAIIIYNAFCGTSVRSSPSSPITVDGQINGIPLTCRVNAVNAVGGGVVSAPSATVTPGVPPTFTSVPAPGGTFGTPYQHSLAASGSPAPSIALEAGNLPPGLTLDANGLLSGTPTSVGNFGGSFRASNGIGTAATQAFSITIAASVPDAPTGVVATPGNAQVTVAFVAPGNTGGVALTGFRASCGNQAANANASPITVTGLPNGTPVGCTVVAINSVGNSVPSAPSNSVTPATVPGAPTAVVAARGNAQVSVAFVAPASNGGSAITGYTATCGAQSQSGTSSPIVVAGLANGTAVSCAVIATNAVGNSVPSAPSNSVTPATVPGAPTAVVATRGNAQVSVAFVAPASNGGSAVTGYSATCGAQSQSGSGSPIVVTGLPNGTAVTCTVIATNSVGNSIPSAPSNSVTPATVPGAPTAVVATRGNALVSVAFVAPASNGGSAITGYTATCGAQSQSGSASPILVTGLSNGTAVTCTVIATNAIGNSVASAPSASVTPATVPGAPIIGAATPGNASATVAFAAPAQSGGEAILDYTLSCTPGSSMVTGASSPLTVGALSNGVVHTCSVRARNAVGLGPSSAPVQVIPDAINSANLGISLTNSTGFVTGGLPVTYTLTVSNAGPAGVVDARVQDVLDPDFSGASWTCIAQGGASCAPSGSGDIDERVVLPMGSSVQFLLTATVAALPETAVSNIASVTPPASISDPLLSNNVATDGPDIRGLFRAGME